MLLKQHIPNFITLLNLFSGSIAVIFAVQGNLVLAALFVALGIFFDFFDGLAARLLDVRTELGLQLDSLADMVTSGVAPGIVMFQLFVMALPSEGSQSSDWSSGDVIFEADFPLLALFGLIVTLASAYRLAKFNIDERQTEAFIGLPTPANALLIMSLPLIILFQPQPLVLDVILNPWFLVVLTLFSAFMLNAEVALFALKFKTWAIGDNKLRYFFLLLSVVLIFVFHFVAIPLIIISYVILSLINNRTGEAEEI